MKIGIVADNYKLDKFKTKLKSKGFTIDIYPFTKDTSSITIETDEAGKKEIAKICTEVELHFKRSN